MLRFLVILSFVLLTACASMKERICKDNTTIPPDNGAIAYVHPDLEVLPPLDLTPYKVDPTSYEQYTANGKLYIGIPEHEMSRQNDLLLLLKNRIYELQEIINTYNSSN